MRLRAWRRAGAVAWSMIAASAAPAHAESFRSRCVDVNTKGQASRLEGKLAEARRLFEKCTDPRCPPLVRKDCAARVEEVNRAQPTIVFDIETPPRAGPVTVTIDGAPSTEALSGSPVKLDPGRHEFVFTLQGKPPITRSITLNEGDKARRERVVFAPPPPPPVPPPPPPPHGWASPENRKLYGMVAGGAGVIGIALGSVFGMMTVSAAKRQRDACPGAAPCPDPAHANAVSAHSDATTDGAISTVAFVVGGVLLAGGAVLYLTARKSSEASRPAISIRPSAGPRDASIQLSGEF